MAKLVQGVRPATGMTTRGLLQGWLFLMAACGVLSIVLGNKSPGGDGGAEKDPDYPALFQDLSHYLNRYYLDLDRISPRNLIEKAFAAMENAVDEIYVENSDPQNPVLVLHVDGHAESFNVSTVTSLETAVKMLERVFVFVKENYHGETPINEVRYAAANGFLAGLDPHTLVFSPEDFKDFSVHIEGEICGVGMYVGSRDGKLQVLEVLKGTPAQKAGFLKGDLIAKIGDESTINMTVTEAVDKIRGACGSDVSLTVKRASPDDPEKLDARTISVERARVVIKSVESKLIPDFNKDGTGPWKGGVGYVQVINFDKNTTPSLRQHLDRLQAENGGKSLAGLILDLRNNSGGLLTQAVDMSDLFLESGEIVIQASRGDKLLKQKAQRDGIEPDYPIVVLSNESSASGAEIVIGALQKNNRAIVLGTRSFGKGSVQQLHQLANDAQLKITVSEYLIPGNISIQENGVVPQILAQAEVEEGGEIDLFPNERAASERNYEKHLVSRYARKESPVYTLNYLFVPSDAESNSDRFMSGDLDPEKDKLVQMALRVMKVADKPFRPDVILSEKKDEILALRHDLFEEIVLHLKEKGIDWSADPSGGTLPIESSNLDLTVAKEFVQEASKEKDDPVPVNKMVVTAKLTNKSTKPIYRMKGISRSDFVIYKDHEFLFGKVEPGQTVERVVKARLPYFPYPRNDLFTVEVSTTGDLPAGDDAPADKVLLSQSLQVELVDAGRPAFAYSAHLTDAKSGERVSELKEGMNVHLTLKVKNCGSAVAHKGIAILRNETGRQIFLEKGRLDFSELKPGSETEFEFAFEVRDGEPVDQYKFEVAVADSYSNATLAKKFLITRASATEPAKTGDASLFVNDAPYTPPEITASLLDPETHKQVLLTGKDSLQLEAVVRAPQASEFKAWVMTAAVGDHDAPPDKILFADSAGKEKLKIERPVSIKKGINLFTVVSSDRNGLESRQSLVVRRE